MCVSTKCLSCLAKLYSESNSLPASQYRFVWPGVVVAVTQLLSYCPKLAASGRLLPSDDPSCRSFSFLLSTFNTISNYTESVRNLIFTTPYSVIRLLLYNARYRLLKSFIGKIMNFFLLSLTLSNFI